MNRETLQNNPVTVTAALGLIVQSVLALLHVDAEVQAAAAQATLAIAVLLRAGVAWWKARKA